MPAECEAAFYVEEHPQLEHYLTVGDPCVATGTTGEWNAFTGSSGGWIPVSFDLSAYSGTEVEIVISYVTDVFTGDTGLMVDDTRFVVNGAATEAQNFEDTIEPWTVLPAPEGSPENSGQFERTAAEGPFLSTTATADTLLFGFGLEQLESDAARAEIVDRMLAHFDE